MSCNLFFLGPVRPVTFLDDCVGAEVEASCAQLKPGQRTVLVDILTLL